MIKGKKIELVALSSEHENFMLELLNDQDIAYWEGRVEPLISLEKQRKWFEKSLGSDNHYLIIRSLTNQELLGYASFKITNVVARDAQLAMKLAKRVQNQGLGTDAYKTLMRYYFINLNMHRLHSHAADYNAASLKMVIDKCGWRKEGIAVKAIYINGQYYDNIYVAILRDEFITNETDLFYNPLYNKVDKQ